MPSNEQRRQAAKRKLERQLERRAEQAKRRRMVTIVTTVAVVIVVVGGVFYFTTVEDQPAASAPGDKQAAQAKQATTGPCAYQPAPEPAAKPVEMPPDPSPTPAQGTVPVKFKLGQGEVTLNLDRAQAPCTVQSFEHLVKSKYFDNTECHRISTSGSLRMLQCGDPTATGTGGPGYQFKDETKPDLTYPRGTLAMANSGPNTNGSQFFMVFGDSQLPPDYTVFGHIDEAGLQVLDKIAQAGSDNSESQGAGKPAQPVRIEQATL